MNKYRLAVGIVISFLLSVVVITACGYPTTNVTQATPSQGTVIVERFNQFHRMIDNDHKVICYGFENTGSDGGASIQCFTKWELTNEVNK